MRRVDSSGSLPLIQQDDQRPSDTGGVRRQSSSDQLAALLQDLYPDADGLPSSLDVVQDDADQRMAQPPPLPARRGGPPGALNPAQVPGLPLVLAQPPGPPPATLTLQVPMPGGGSAAWSPSLDALGPDLAKRVRSTGTDRVDFATVQTEIQTKLTRGAALAQQLATAGGPQQLSEQNVTDLAWFMQARAEIRTGTTNAPDVAFTLPDPHGAFLGSLDRTTSAVHGGLAYQRASTHLEAFQQAQGGAPRGINLVWDKNNPTNLDRLLPNGKETILYQKMSAGVKGYPEDRVFFKPEEHGVVHFKPKHGLDAGGPTRGHLPHDKRHTFGHIMTTGPSLVRQITGNNNPVGSFKERVPSHMVNAYKDILKAAQLNVKHWFEMGDPTNKSSGLRVMAGNINAFWNAFKDDLDFQKKNPELTKALINFNQQYLTGGMYDNVNLRIGQEIIFTANDLQ